MAEICPFEVTPLAQSKLIERIPFRNLDYTSQDYWSLKKRVIDIIRKNYSDVFTDFTEASLAMMLLECWAFIADTLSFKIDQIANELYIDTVTEIENAFRLAKLLGFKPSPPLPARALFVANITTPYTEDIVISTPYIVRPEGEARTYELYATDADNNPAFGQPIVIPAGQLHTKSIIGIEGKTLTTTRTSTGEAYQIIELPINKAYKNAIGVAVDGVVWDEVETFSDQPRMEYKIEYNSKYKPFVIFGNNKSGLIPPKDSKIKLQYRTGVGGSGNIITGAVDEKIYAYVPGLSQRVTVSVKNYTKGEFGFDGDSLEDIRRKLPLYIGVQNRAVTGNDYKLLAEQFQTQTNGMVGKATVALRNHGCAGNIIDVYVLAREGADNLALANANLKNELMEYLDKKKIFTDHICIKDGEVIDVDVQIDVVLDRFNRKFENVIREKIERRIDNFFLLTRWDYGVSLCEADIIKALSDIQEISRFDITFTSTKGLENGGDSETVSAKYYEIIRPDNISVSFTYKMPGEE